MAKGVVVSFDRGRGFGFIRSREFPDDVFVHVEAVEGRTPLQPGQRVEFSAYPTDRGPRADRVVPGRAGLPPGLAAVGSVLLVLIALTLGLHQLGLAWVGAYLGVISAATWTTFAWDKRQANLHARRIPENVLLGLSLVGGSPAALVAMPVLHHKTRKTSFRLKFAGVLLIQALALAAWWGTRHAG